MMAIIEGGIHVASYSASKHALYGYLASMRQEYQKFGKNITLSIGCPYAINTTMFKGFKTKLDFFVRVLDEKYVGERLVREFVSRKEVCMMYLYEAFMFRILSFMPSQVVDFAAKTLDVSKYATMTKKS
jgi:short-subunit dehydrogenase